MSTSREFRSSGKFNWHEAGHSQSRSKQIGSKKGAKDTSQPIQNISSIAQTENAQSKSVRCQAISAWHWRNATKHAPEPNQLLQSRIKSTRANLVVTATIIKSRMVANAEILAAVNAKKIKQFELEF